MTQVVASGSNPKLATSKRDLKAVDSELESDEESNSPDDQGQSSDSDSDDEDESPGDGSLGDSNEDGEDSGVDVDAPRVAQWVDEEDLEQPEVPSGDISHGKTVDLEDIVRFFMSVSPN